MLGGGGVGGRLIGRIGKRCREHDRGCVVGLGGRVAATAMARNSLGC